MSNRYKVVGRRPVLDGQPGEEFEADLSAQEEYDHIAAGRLEIVPRPYRVIGPHSVHGTPNGEVFTGALTIGQEQSLIEAGHIERVKEKKEAAKEPKAEPKEKAEA